MKRLIIKAHPARYGFTHKIVERIGKKLSEGGGEFFVMDLYSKDWKQDFLTFEDSSDFNEKEKRKKIQEKIVWAEELVFVYPLWWSSMPAILKNFLDQNLTSGFAFSYKNKKPQGLLKDKTARVFVTADTPPSFIPFLYFFIRNPIDRFSLMFCGIKVLSFNIFSQMNKKKNDADREKILKKVGKIFSK